MSGASSIVFVGRGRLLAELRRATDAGLDVHLTGEAGVGKTALARRTRPDALYLPHCSPAGELLCGVLSECYKRGWWDVPGDDGTPLDDLALAKAVKKLGQKPAQAEAIKALKRRQDAGTPALLILDNFDAAPVMAVRIVRALAPVATLIAIGHNPKPTHKPFLFGCTQIEVLRLSKSEADELTSRLLEPHQSAGRIHERERASLQRQILEQAQGLPAVIVELVKRAEKRGELSLRGVAGEDVHGTKTVDMTPGLMVVGILLVGFRMAMRGLHDADMSVLIGFSGAFLMLARLFASRLSGRGGRR